ncbi:CRISPR-associated helicase/endonuclease Cas3 [Pararhodospirillum photometricum]|nr:CRISPR-associated helicase/endonuclease Cas3 [Pararhodospirillum photometricum]
MEDWKKFWGKARPKGKIGAHPALYHALDVAACVEALLKADPGREALWAATLGVERETARAVAVCCAAVHDLGKLSAPFQIKVPALWPSCLGQPASPPSPSHDTAGWLWWQAKAPSEATSLAPLMRAAFGHHGEPPHKSDDLSPLRLAMAFPPAASEVAAEFVRWVFQTLPQRPIPVLREDRATAASFLLAGLVTLGDWLGSSQTWFEYTAPDLTWGAYWAKAQAQAQKAVAAAGLQPALSAARLGYTDLGIDKPPTPLQAWAQDVALPEGPLLVVLEDLTGSGKTEAALMLAHRLIASGRAQGLYFALPTQATANALFDRLARVIRAFFAPDTTPSLALTHGDRAMHPGFRAALNRGAALGFEASQKRQEKPEGDTVADISAEAQCAAWVGEDRRLSFLADIGAGTLDQALLAILPARHAAVRRWGLLGKVLILDEIHAYDAYMGEEIIALIEAHAAEGGHTLLLSATLPQNRRRALEEAFHRGTSTPRPASRGFGAAGQALAAKFAHPPKPPPPPPEGFPRAGVVSADHQTADFPPPWPARIRRLPVKRVDSIDQALAQVAAAARAGQAVLLLRNTVDEALSSHAALRALGLEPWLFHARFALGDRQNIERRVMETFGRESTPEQRRGQILVATQVVEQSLDLDFDALFTDLAPIDLLIQRAGRLWRHLRALRHGAPVLHVIAPERSDPAAWVRHLPPGTAAVYQDLGVLWRTAETLEAEGALDLPERARTLIDAVYDATRAAPLPDAVARAAEEAQGKAYAHQSLARTQVLPRHEGYRRVSAWEDDRRVMTRWGEPTVSVVLARLEDGHPVPWCPAPAEAPQDMGWRLSRVTLRAHQIAADPDPLPALAALRASWPAWERDMPIVLLHPDGNDVWSASARDDRGRPVRLRYSRERGASFGEE